MQQSLELVSNLNQLPPALKKQAVDYLAYACKEILEGKVKRAYAINASKRTGKNFISLEDMLEAVSVDVSYNPVAISVFIDEGKILWEDKIRERRGETSHYGDEGFAFSYQDSIVGGSEGREKFRREAMTMRQNDWVLRESLVDIQSFIKKDFQFYLENKILRQQGGSYKNGKKK